MAPTAALVSFSSSPSPLAANTALAISPMATAGASLLLSSTIGLLLEKNTKPGHALGASLITFILQAVLSNFHLIPMDSPAYDACWGKVLPASLSLSVLLAVAAAGSTTATAAAAPTLSPSAARPSQLSPLHSKPWRIMETPLWKVTIANIFGAIGALLGGLLAFQLASHYQTQFTRIVLAKVVASIATTHIGGSINFFQVARAVGLDQEGQGLLGAVAGADIFLMALYFAALLGIQRSPAGTAAFLRYGGLDKGWGKESGEVGMGKANSRAVVSFTSSPSPAADDAASRETAAVISFSSLLPSFVALLLAFAAGEGGQWIERKVGVPGMAAGTITALSIGVFGLLRRVSPRFFALVARPAKNLSSFLFSLFFAAIGAGASLAQLVQSGPVIVALMSLSLFIHLITTLGGLRVYNGCVPPLARVAVDEAVIGSNANIGGPATAAAMAGSIDRPDLVLPAAATGTGGYALATFLGVVLFRSLTR